MMTDERLAELPHLIEYGQTCDHHWVDSDTGYLLDMAAESVAEIERLRSLLPVGYEACDVGSDDGEPVTSDWLEAVGLLWYREFAAHALDAETRGDARRLAAMFGVKLREGTE